MKMHHRQSLSFRLEPEEQFDALNDAGMAFRVEVIELHFRAGTVQLRGRAIKKDGTRAAFNREGISPIFRLPERVKDAMLGQLLKEFG